MPVDRRGSTESGGSGESGSDEHYRPLRGRHQNEKSRVSTSQQGHATVPGQQRDPLLPEDVLRIPQGVPPRGELLRQQQQQRLQLPRQASLPASGPISPSRARAALSPNFEDLTKLERKRQKNAFYSKRKRERQKLQVQKLHLRVAELERERKLLRCDNNRLENILVAARILIGKIEESGGSTHGLGDMDRKPSGVSASPNLFVESSINQLRRPVDGSNAHTLPPPSAAGIPDRLQYQAHPATAEVSPMLDPSLAKLLQLQYGGVSQSSAASLGNVSQPVTTTPSIPDLLANPELLHALLQDVSRPANLTAQMRHLIEQERVGSLMRQMEQRQLEDAVLIHLESKRGAREGQLAQLDDPGLWISQHPSADISGEPPHALGRTAGVEPGVVAEAISLPHHDRAVEGSGQNSYIQPQPQQPTQQLQDPLISNAVSSLLQFLRRRT